MDRWITNFVRAVIMEYIGLNLWLIAMLFYISFSLNCSCNALSMIYVINILIFTIFFIVLHCFLKEWNKELKRNLYYIKLFIVDKFQIYYPVYVASSATSNNVHSKWLPLAHRADTVECSCQPHQLPFLHQMELAGCCLLLLFHFLVKAWSGGVSIRIFFLLLLLPCIKHLVTRANDLQTRTVPGNKSRMAHCIYLNMFVNKEGGFVCSILSFTWSNPIPKPIEVYRICRH